MKLAAATFLAFSLSVFSSGAVAQDAGNQPGVRQEAEHQENFNPVFYRPSSAAEVGRAIRLQQLAMRKEAREPQHTSRQVPSQVPSLPLLSRGMRQEQSEDGVIVLTNRRKPRTLPSVARGTTDSQLDSPTLHQLDLEAVLEESSVISRLRPMNSKLSAQGAQSDGNAQGLDIALAVLVAVGLGFFGFSAWQRRQNS